MPSLPSHNGNYGYYYKSDEFSHSACRSIGRFVFIMLVVTFWSLLFSSWWFVANYLILNYSSLYHKFSFDFIDRYILQLQYLLLHLLMLILITSTIRPYRIIHQLIINKKRCQLITFFSITIILIAILLEIPYAVLRDKSVYSSSTYTESFETWCKYGQCAFWTLSHIIDYYLYCALLPFCLFIFWWIMEYCIFSRFCRNWSLYYGNNNTITSLTQRSFDEDSSRYTAHEPRRHNHRNSGMIITIIYGIQLICLCVICTNIYQ